MIIDDYFYEKFMKNPEKGTQRIFNFLSKIGHPQKKLNNIIHELLSMHLCFLNNPLFLFFNGYY